MLNHFFFYIALALLFLSLTEFREDIENFYYNKIKWKTPTSRSKFIKYNKILTRNFNYYTNLSKNGKAKFINRLVSFIDSKEFKGKSNLVIIEEMKVLIAASIIQLTFGLEKFTVNYFHTILVYPKKYYSAEVGDYIIGGVSERGTISISWRDFLKDYIFPHNSYNLGLHEMAHVLKINLLKGTDFDDRFSFYIDEWFDITERDYQKIKSKRKNLLRTYGGINKDEFFAVCVEYFFETPIYLKKKAPDLYNHLCFLLNQDPLNIDKDYIISENFKEKINKNKSLIPLPEKLIKNYYYHHWHWTSTILLLGLFGGSLAIIFISKYTDITLGEIIEVAIIGAIIATICQFHYLFFNTIYTIKGFLVYLLLGICPLVSGVFLALNIMFYTNIHSKKIKIKELNYYKNNVVLILEENTAKIPKKFRTFESESFIHNRYPIKPSYLYLTAAKGLFGYDVVVSRKLKGY